MAKSIGEVVEASEGFSTGNEGSVGETDVFASTWVDTGVDSSPQASIHRNIMHAHRGRCLISVFRGRKDDLIPGLRASFSKVAELNSKES